MQKWYENKTIIILLLVFCFPIGLFVMWKYANWNRNTKAIVSAVTFWAVVIMVIGTFNQPPEIPEDTGTSSADTTSEASDADESIPSENTSSEDTYSSNEPAPSSSAPSSQPAPSSTTDPSSNDTGNGITIYATPSGERYHYDPDCGGKNSSIISWDRVNTRGLTPCQKCAQ